MTDPHAQARALTAELRAQLWTVVLGTAAADGTPDASVAAALLDLDGAFVIYNSALAAHTRNLRVNPRASVLLTTAESSIRSAWARPRLSFACLSEPVARDAEMHQRLIAAFREKFGATIELLATLPDFQFYRLRPQSGRVVAGFGVAFNVDPLDWSQLTPIGASPAR
ncbi:MAG: pyridoxamine 5'-phosphate oxidase family protein [Opitutaceae bacterium]